MNLNTFIQTGSLSKTADKLGVPIATISRQITELEKSLGVQLFDRQKTGVKPTLAGQQFYEQIALSVDNLTQITQHFSADDSDVGGKLRISTIAGMDEIWAWIDEFCELYPKVSVHFTGMNRGTARTCRKHGRLKCRSILSVFFDGYSASAGGFPFQTACPYFLHLPERV